MTAATTVANGPQWGKGVLFSQGIWGASALPPDAAALGNAVRDRFHFLAVQAGRTDLWWSLDEASVYSRGGVPSDADPVNVESPREQAILSVQERFSQYLPHHLHLVPAEAVRLCTVRASIHHGGQVLGGAEAAGREPPEREGLTDALAGVGERSVMREPIARGGAEMIEGPSQHGDVDQPSLEGFQQRQLLIYARDLSRTYQRLKQAQSELKDMYLSTLTVLASAIEARDTYLVGHSTAVEAFALQVGRSMGLSAEQLESLRWAALLHDIGKIGIPDTTLRKRGPLDPDEWRHMRQHPEVGYRILSSLTFLGEALPGIRYHHERYDGRGYPAGLSGQEIPFLARVLSPCDALDAMLSDRTYRRALSYQEAVDQLDRNRGSQFDPEVVDAVKRAIPDATAQEVRTGPVATPASRELVNAGSLVPSLATLPVHDMPQLGAL